MPRPRVGRHDRVAIDRDRPAGDRLPRLALRRANAGGARAGGRPRDAHCRRRWGRRHPRVPRAARERRHPTSEAAARLLDGGRRVWGLRRRQRMGGPRAVRAGVDRDLCGDLPDRPAIVRRTRGISGRAGERGLPDERPVRHAGRDGRARLLFHDAVDVGLLVWDRRTGPPHRHGAADVRTGGNRLPPRRRRDGAGGGRQRPAGVVPVSVFPRVGEPAARLARDRPMVRQRSARSRSC